MRIPLAQAKELLEQTVGMPSAPLLGLPPAAQQLSAEDKDFLTNRVITDNPSEERPRLFDKTLFVGCESERYRL